MNMNCIVLYIYLYKCIYCSFLGKKSGLFLLLLGEKMVLTNKRYSSVCSGLFKEGVAGAQQPKQSLAHTTGPCN